MKRTHIRNLLVAAGLAAATAVGLATPVAAQMGSGGMGPGMMGNRPVAPSPERSTPPDAERAPARGYGYGYGPGYGMGPGMMGHMMGGYGMGPEMMGGYGPGYGMGPGMMGHMMGGYGMGPGMMGHMMGGYGYGMGPGMMGHMMGGYAPGYGMGPGMMGHMMGGYGYGMGPGMMGGRGYGMPGYPDLSAEQREKLDAIHKEFARKQWGIADKMHDEAAKLHELATADQRDRAAIIGQYKKLQDLRLQRFQARLDARDKIDGVLTPEQREQARRFGSWRP